MQPNSVTGVDFTGVHYVMHKAGMKGKLYHWYQVYSRKLVGAGKQTFQWW